MAGMDPQLKAKLQKQRYHIVGEHLNDAGQDITNQLEWEINGFSGLGMDFELCFDWFGAIKSVESNVLLAAEEVELRECGKPRHHYRRRRRRLRFLRRAR